MENQKNNFKHQLYNMKKQILFIAIFLFAGLSSLTAQEARQRLSVEERTKAAIEKLTPLNLDEESKNRSQQADFRPFSNRERCRRVRHPRQWPGHQGDGLSLNLARR